MGSLNLSTAGLLCIAIITEAIPSPTGPEIATTGSTIYDAKLKSILTRLMQHDDILRAPKEKSPAIDDAKLTKELIILKKEGISKALKEKSKSMLFVNTPLPPELDLDERLQKRMAIKKMIDSTYTLIYRAVKMV